ncbi:MAG: DUF3108 domain-containing protein [Proteobacteria bacterium]|nr:DUF3108 domain-containing protein [Pseudomonadota bacterium]
MPRLVIAIGLLVLAASAFAGAGLKPERASYVVSRDGKAIGTAAYSLAANPDGTWTLRSETRGTGGMAKLLGLDVREESVFALRDGKLQGLRYDYTQDAAIKHKRRHIDFDWHAQQVHVRDNGKDFRFAAQAGAIDRSTLAVALGLALADGTKTATLPVAVRDRVERQQYAATTTASLALPAGTFTATEIDRIDKPGKARSWYEAGASVLPVRVEQIQHDGSTLVLELASR